MSLGAAARLMWFHSDNSEGYWHRAVCCSTANRENCETADLARCCPCYVNMHLWSLLTMNVRVADRWRVVVGQKFHRGRLDLCLLLYVFSNAMLKLGGCVGSDPRGRHVSLIE